MYHSDTYWLSKIPQAIRKLDDLETEKCAAIATCKLPILHKKVF